MSEAKGGTRRRGDALELAIVDAAWEELSQVGYTQMTMESVAKRAETNKAVLYRRWPNKTELVMTTIKARLPKIPDEIPDTGSLRDDVFSYLHDRVVPLGALGTPTIRGLMSEPQVWRLMSAALQHHAERTSEGKITQAIRKMLGNAKLRGEIATDDLPPRIVSLPIDLMKCELITKLEPISDAALAEIVDVVFMPLVLEGQKQVFREDDETV